MQIPRFRKDFAGRRTQIHRVEGGRSAGVPGDTPGRGGPPLRPRCPKVGDFSAQWTSPGASCLHEARSEYFLTDPGSDCLDQTHSPLWPGGWQSRRPPEIRPCAQGSLLDCWSAKVCVQGRRWLLRCLPSWRVIRSIKGAPLTLRTWRSLPRPGTPPLLWASAPPRTTRPASEPGAAPRIPGSVPRTLGL